MYLVLCGPRVFPQGRLLEERGLAEMAIFILIFLSLGMWK